MPNDTPPPAHSARFDDISKWSDSLVWFGLALVIGLGSTALLFVDFVRNDEERVALHVERGLEALVAFAVQPFLAPLMQQLNDTMVGLQTAIHSGRPLNQQLLDEYLWDTPPFGLETTSLEYLARTGPEFSDPYSTALATPETAGFPIVEQTADGLRQAPPRAEYFPVLLEAFPEQRRSTLGLDRTNDELYRLALLQARDSGMITVYSQFPLPGTAVQEQTAFYVLPVYVNGSVPATLEERRRSLSGIISLATYVPADDVFALLFKDVQGILTTYFPESADLDSNPEFAFIQQLRQNNQAARVDYVTQGLPFTALGVASPALRVALSTNQRWWALGSGLLLTACIGLMLLWLRNQSKYIKALVSARTRDLQERTDALGAANSALQQSETRYRMLAEHATDVIYTCDLKGVYTYVSPGIRQQRGFAADEFIGKPLNIHLPDESILLLREMLAEGTDLVALESSSAPLHFEDSLEYQARCKDGSLKWLETTLTLLRDADGKASGFLGVTRDISERKLAEHEHEALEEALKQSQKMDAIGTLAGGIAHDFNNLLTAIFGYADILRSQVGHNPAAEESIGIIEKAATRASDLTRQLLGFARKGRFQAVQVNLNDTLTDVIALLKSSVDKNITIVRNLSTRPPTVIGDPDQLGHLFLNLGINARDAMPEGGTLTFSSEIVGLDAGFCRLHPELRPGRYNLVTVADTGIGISKEDLSRIFEPFFTKKAQGKGTGLGLAMVYGGVTSHGGSVLVDSEPGRGSVLRVYLPYTQGELVVPPVEKPVHLARGQGTIVVVDDEEAVRNLARSMLSELGYTVVVAQDGVAGVEVFRRHPETALVIVDMVMPNMDGYQCIEALKAIDPAVRVILTTGYSREALGENLNRPEIRGFLPKPWNRQQLSTMVADALTPAE